MTKTKDKTESMTTYVDRLEVMLFGYISTFTAVFKHPEHSGAHAPLSFTKGDIGVDASLWSCGCVINDVIRECRKLTICNHAMTLQ